MGRHCGGLRYNLGTSTMETVRVEARQPVAAIGEEGPGPGRGPAPRGRGVGRAARLWAQLRTAHPRNRRASRSSGAQGRQGAISAGTRPTRRLGRPPLVAGGGLHGERQRPDCGAGTARGSGRQARDLQPPGRRPRGGRRVPRPDLSRLGLDRAGRTTRSRLPTRMPRAAGGACAPTSCSSTAAAATSGSRSSIPMATISEMPCLSFAAWPRSRSPMAEPFTGSSRSPRWTTALCGCWTSPKRRSALP